MEITKATTAPQAVRAYRLDCKRVLTDAKVSARKQGHAHWHFVGRGVEIIALDETGERNDDCGGPEFIQAKELSLTALKDTVKVWLRHGNCRDGHTLSAIHLAGGFDVYDSFAEYMQDMREGGCGEYEIWDDWAGQDIPVGWLT